MRTKVATKAIKVRMTKAHFERVFEVTYDASHVEIIGVLSQGGHPVIFFGKKLNDACLYYSTYDMEFYCIGQALRHWDTISLARSLSCTTITRRWSTLTLRKRLVLGMQNECLSSRVLFCFEAQSWSQEKKVVDALIRSLYWMATLSIKVIGFDKVKQDYVWYLPKKTRLCGWQLF